VSLGVCVVIGIVVTVGFAWVPVLLIDFPAKNGTRSFVMDGDVDCGDWTTAPWADLSLTFPSPRYIVLTLFDQPPQPPSREPLPSLSLSTLPSWVARSPLQFRGAPSQRGWDAVLTMGTGWPWRSACRYMLFSTATEKYLDSWDVRFLGRDVHLPLRPIWSGLILDTLLFASVVALPVFGVPAMRRSRRRRRGLCVACGYPRPTPVSSAAIACPECGLSA